MMTDKEVFQATRNCIAAWNSLDLKATLATYTDDVVYRDPKTQGKIIGKPALTAYLTKFFRVWNMQFRVIEERRIVDMDGQLCMWECDISLRDGGETKTVTGMDICVARGTQLCRDEAFMDTTVLAQLRSGI